MKKLVETLRSALRPRVAAATRALQLSLFGSGPVEAPAQRRAPEAPAPVEPPPGPGVTGASPSFEQLRRGDFTRVRVEVKARLRGSWRVQWTPRGEELRVEVPPRLADAPQAVKEALLEWALLVTARKSRRDPAVRSRRAAVEELIRGYLAAQEAHGPAAKRRKARNARRLERLEPKGLVHDLEDSFDRINRDYFAGALQARLTWSRRLGGLSTHSMAEDADGNAYHLISISRGYDCPEVTPEILGGVVYHECLHIAIPPRVESGRRIIHGSDFRRREKAYAHYDLWRRWHREGLPKALRRMRRQGR
jgi:hypothetical protein